MEAAPTIQQDNLRQVQMLLGTNLSPLANRPFLKEKRDCRTSERLRTTP